MDSSSRNSGPTGAATPQERAPTKALAWWQAREAGARLTPHVLPEDTETVLWTQEMERTL